MKIGIVGWGVEGQGVYKYFGPDHNYLIVGEHPRDDFPPESTSVKVQYLTAAKPAGISGNVENLDYLEGLDSCDKIIYTPIAYYNLKKFFGDNPDFWAKAATAQHIFFENVRTKNIIGVTGTKGKGTTSTLIYEMLKTAGKNVFLAGNIGRSVLDFINDVGPEDWVILELANFQLHKFPYSPHIGVCLLIVPEHLDWHPNMGDYLEAKSNIFKHQKPDDIAIYFADNEYSRQIAGQSKGLKIPYFKKPGARVRKDGIVVIGDDQTKIINSAEVKLLGEHNLQNVCAATTAVWQVIQNVETIAQTIKEFGGLPHRLEFVRELDNIKYYNDSFAATPDAAVAAMQAIPGRKVMILGGFDRNLPLEHLAQSIKEHARDLANVVIMGASAHRLGKALTNIGFTDYKITPSDNMQEIVNLARSLAKPGEAVVLSPGFPSFDMFKNFEVRGDAYKQTVDLL